MNYKVMTKSNGKWHRVGTVVECHFGYRFVSCTCGIGNSRKPRTDEFAAVPKSVGKPWRLEPIE